jgi:S1-C subfamily serine protease
MATGGMILEDLPADERKKADLETGMALRVKGLGQGDGPHGTARRVGFQQGDVLIAYDRRSDLPRETDLLAHALLTRKPGDKVTVTVLRGGKKINLTLPMQE